MIQRIIVPTDFSPCADHASIIALRFAKTTQSRITFLHYFKKPWFFSSEKELRIKYSHQLKQHIQNLAAEAGIELNDKVDFYSKSGSMLKDLPAFCVKHFISMAIMGTKGAGAGHESAKYFGSKTMKFIKSTYTPVLAIPDKGHLEDIKSIVYATDYKEVTGASFDYVLKIGEMFQALITVLHVRKPYEMFNVKRDSAFASDNLVYKYKNIQKVTLSNPDVIAGIDEYIKSNRVDMLALSVNNSEMIERLFHNSVFQKFILESDIPVLAAK